MTDKRKMRPEAMTTRQLLNAARRDPDPVSCFGTGTTEHDSQEAIFVVKGKTNVRRVEGMLIGLGMMSTRPIFTNDQDA